MARHSVYHFRPGKGVPSVTFHGAAIGEFSRVMGIGRRRQESFVIVNGQIQIEIVHVSAKEMEFADDLGSQRAPVASGIFEQVVAVIAHIFRDTVVDLAGRFIPKGNRVAVRTDWTVDCFPGFELISRTSVAPQYGLEYAQVASG